MATKRTTVILDTDLMRDAGVVLGTTKATDTIRAALERAVYEKHVRDLVAWELPDSAADDLDALRRTSWRG